MIHKHPLQIKLPLSDDRLGKFHHITRTRSSNFYFSFTQAPNSVRAFVYHETPLQTAVYNSNLRMARMLIEGCDLTWVDQIGVSWFFSS